MKNFKPMLASNIEIQNIKFPVLGSRKMEGVRGEFTPNGLLTRPMKKFNNKLVELKFAKLVSFCKEYNTIVEGEFYVHGMSFNEISSVCRRANHPDTDIIEFHVFDMYDLDSPDEVFSQRAECAKQFLPNIGCDGLHVVEQKRIISREQAFREYDSALLDGYEGYVFKAPCARYKTGRSTAKEQIFVRIKPENTYDGIVIDIVERMENLVASEVNELGYLSKRQDKDMKASTGLAAVAVVDSPDFPELVRVSLTRGIKDYEDTIASRSRRYIWQNRDEFIGKHLRFVGLPIPGMDLPRSPRFDAWRTDLD